MHNKLQIFMGGLTSYGIVSSLLKANELFLQNLGYFLQLQEMPFTGKEKGFAGAFFSYCVV